MALITVSTNKLEEGAQTIESKRKALEQEITALKSSAARYLSYWEGESKNAFVKSVNDNANLLTTFTNNTQKFADALRTGATNYESGEKKAIEIAMNKGQ